MCFGMVPMPSYAMIIMVGSLESTHLDLKHNVSLWAEKKYIEQSKTNFSQISIIFLILPKNCVVLSIKMIKVKYQVMLSFQKKLMWFYTTMCLCNFQCGGIDVNIIMMRTYWHEL